MKEKELEGATVLQLAALYKTVFGTPEGKKVLGDILTRICRVDGGLFNPDTHVMAHTIGRRDVGLEIRRLVEMIVEEAQKPEVKKHERRE